MNFVAAIKKILANDKIASIFAAACFFSLCQRALQSIRLGWRGTGKATIEKYKFTTAIKSN